ncbi:GDSL-like Lipase/Acylhydrolase superfamily protein [Prunus dulcis]|uniref:GDSL-like Lipase/Acylhydrolase superfamily protein n=1 Tax=Prunus dulcis TaxID=3755 RepID=A0A4Y1QSE4_PRUDU|nr:GDSL-like Lipase/Acylhydrolase superfamily protein [Prunus dulcis]
MKNLPRPPFYLKQKQVICRAAMNNLFFFMFVYVDLILSTAQAIVKLPNNVTIPGVFMFGDSIVDTGNNNNLTTLVKSNFLPYGRDFMGGLPTGRFGNGKVPSDLIALGAQLDLQRHELDCILQLQNEKLRQKEEHLAQATKRAIELQDCLRKAEMESETWQRMAKANETMVIDLNNTLEQVRERLVFVSNEAEDAESCCGSCDRGGHRDNDRVAMLQEHRVVEEKGKKLACKNCNTRRSCVLFLPCRHLCSCKSCEPFLGSCPVCESTKEASMEVFLV